MNRKINIRQTFQAIRKMPLEVSFEQVERWIIIETPKPISFFQKIKSILKRYF